MGVIGSSSLLIHQPSSMLWSPVELVSRRSRRMLSLHVLVHIIRSGECHSTDPTYDTLIVRSAFSDATRCLQVPFAVLKSVCTSEALAAL